MHIYEIYSRKDKCGVGLISDTLPLIGGETCPRPIWHAWFKRINSGTGDVARKGQNKAVSLTSAS